MISRNGVWIVDTSPFVGLAKVGYLDLLASPTRQVWIADVVIREIMAGPENDPARRALEQEWKMWSQQGFMRVTASAPIPDALGAMELDAGEEAVLALALNAPPHFGLLDDRCVTVIDDSAGRAVARALGIPVVGTVGVLLQARADGRFPVVAPVLHALHDAGLFLPKPGLLTTLLAAIGERWP